MQRVYVDTSVSSIGVKHVSHFEFNVTSKSFKCTSYLVSKCSRVSILYPRISSSPISKSKVVIT